MWLTDLAVVALCRPVHLDALMPIIASISHGVVGVFSLPGESTIERVKAAVGWSALFATVTQMPPVDDNQQNCRKTSYLSPVSYDS